MKRFKLFGWIVAAVALVYGVSAAGLYAAMCQSPERFGAIMSRVPDVAMLVLQFEPLWMRARGGALRVGDRAPDFSLPRLNGGGGVNLSGELREHPVVLVFGSYT
jgi:hypothetical protein